MTPAPPHLEQEYIITEEQLDWILKGRAKIQRTITAKQIRSRPHTTTPSEREQISETSFLWDITKEEFDILTKAYAIRLRESLRTPTEAHR